MIDLNELSQKAVTNSKNRARNGDFGEPDDYISETLKHCSGEFLEAMEAYCAFREFRTDILKKQLAGELADVIMCAMVVSGIMGIDIENALTECAEKNRARGEK